MPYVANRWLGGLLTNWRTIADRISYLQELRRLRRRASSSCSPAKERITMLNELEKLESNLGGVSSMKRQPDAIFIVDLQEGATRGPRGETARPAGDRAGRHELRPG